MPFYDVFVSYADDDRHWVEGYLLPHLHAADFRIATDETIVTFSEPYWFSLSRVLQHTHTMLLVVTAKWVEEEWASYERLFRSTQHPSDADPPDTTLLIVRGEVEMPTLLQSQPQLDCTHEEHWKPHMMEIIKTITHSQQQYEARQEANEKEPSQHVEQRAEEENTAAKSIVGFSIKRLAGIFRPQREKRG